MPKDVPTRATFQAWNERMSRMYDPDIYYTTGNPVVRRIECARIEKVIDFLQVKPEDTVLDAGCGKGFLLRKLPHCKKYGIDLSLPMVEDAKGYLGDTAVVEQLPAEDTKFPSGFFSKIACSEVLEHVLDPSQVLRELRRIVTDTGTVVVSIPNESLIRSAKSSCAKLRLRSLLKLPTEGGVTRVMGVENPWHLHDASLAMFHAWNTGYFSVVRISQVPAFLPLHYVIILRPA